MMKSATVKTIHGFGVLTAACGLLAAGICHAVDFPLAGGDLASPTDWGQAVPGSSDDVVLPSSGTYTLGGDVSFKTLFAGSGASNLVFDFTNGNHTVTLYGTEAREVLKPVLNDNATVVFRGGVWKFNTAANVAMPWKSSSKVVLTDGCMVTNAATFNLGWGATQSRLDVTNGASLYVSGLSLNDWGNPSNVLSITAGGVVSVDGDCWTDKGYAAGKHSANGVLVSGMGSKLRQTRSTHTVAIGYTCTKNWMCIEDGGECSVDGTLRIGTGATSVGNEVTVRRAGILSVNKFQIQTSGNSTVVSNATLRATKLSFAAGSSNNVVRVKDGSTATIGDTLFSSGGNRLEVCNANYVATNSVQLGDATSVTGNVMVVSGSETEFCWTNDVYGPGCGNLFELTDGAAWRTGGADLELMYQSSNNVMRVTGGAIFDNTSSPAGNKRLRIGGYWAISGGNTLEILDGATVNVEALSIAGVDSRIVVSNATLQTMSSDAYGIWLGHGYNDERGSCDKLIVQGTTPAVRLKEYKSTKGSTIRFEVPAEGYAEGHVPVTATTLNPGSTATEKFEIDCAAWAANPNAVRRLVLMRCSTDISAANAAWVIAQNPNLPENVRLKVSGGDVILYKPDGLMMIVF